MVLIADAQLMRLFKGLLLLTGCEFFTIYPPPGSIARRDTWTCHVFHKDVVLKIQQILSVAKDNEFNSQRATELGRMGAEFLSKTTFLDFNTNLECHPARLMAMLDKVDKNSRLVRIKVVPNFNCKYLLEQKFGPTDERLDTIYICRRDANPFNSSSERREYALVWDPGQYAVFGSFDDDSYGMETFGSGMENFEFMLSRKLLPESTNRSLNTLIDKPFCPYEFKRYNAAKITPSKFGREQRVIWLILIIGSPFSLVMLCVLLCGCIRRTFEHFVPDPDRHELIGGQDKSSDHND